MEREQTVLYPTLIRDLPADDRPRERLRDFGASALSAAELLAILLRTGSARESALAQAARLLATFGDLTGMARASFAELCAERGLGEAKAAQLQAAIELGIRVQAAAPQERPVMRSPEDVARIHAPEMSLFEQEHVRVVLLDARNRMLASEDVYRGSVHTTNVRVGELFRPAVRANAAGIVLVHNHPSGDPSPSAADIQLTQMMIEAGKLLDIDVLDHLVIGGGKHVSLRAAGVGFAKQAAERPNGAHARG